MSTEKIGLLGRYWLTLRPGRDTWHRAWYDEDARQTRYVTYGTTSQEDAMVEHAEWYAKFGRDRLKDAPKDAALLSNCLLDYIDYMEGKPGGSYAKYASAHWRSFFGNADLSGIVGEATLDHVTPKRLEDFARHLATEHELTLSTVSGILGVGRSAMRRMYRRGELVAAPHVFEPMTKAQKFGRPPMGRPLSMEEMAQLFDTIRTAHIFMFCIMATNTLARPRAILDATIFQYQRDYGLLDLNPPGRVQNNKHRPIVPVTSVLRPWLESVKNGHFVNYFGKPITTTRFAFANVRKLAGLDGRVNGYSFRHTMAREMRRRRVPGEEISLMLGHQVAGAKTTQIYAPYDPSYCSNAVAAIEDYFHTLQKMTKRPLIGPRAVDRFQERDMLPKHGMNFSKMK